MFIKAWLTCLTCLYKYGRGNLCGNCCSTDSRKVTNITISLSSSNTNIVFLIRQMGHCGCNYCCGCWPCKTKNEIKAKIDIFVCLYIKLICTKIVKQKKNTFECGPLLLYNIVNINPPAIRSSCPDYISQFWHFNKNDLRLTENI